MSLHLADLWRSRWRRTERRTIRRFRPVHVRPRLEMLEDRIVPSTIQVMNTNASGTGSLAAAVSSAQTGDNITFAPGLSGTIAVNSPLTFQAGVTNVSVTGPSSLVTISGQGASEVFHIVAGDSVTLSNLHITGGSATVGAGIDNAGMLTLNNCLIDHNTAATALLGLLGLSGGGGGIVNESTGVLVGNNTTIASNSVQNGLVSVTAVSGGGLANLGGKVTLTNCTIANNNINSTVSLLTASGAGLENTGGGTMTLVNCTVAGNTITSLLSVAGSGGGIDNAPGSTLNLVNTIVVDPNGATTGPDVNGTIANAVDSIFASSTQGQILNSLLGGSLLGNVFNNNLLGSGLLGGLGLNNGGSTPTLPLLGNILNNPAIGGGLNPDHLTTTLTNLLNSLGVSLPSLDQNGLARALNFLDIGSVQSLLPTVTSVVGNPQNGLTQLVATIAGPDGVLNTLTNGVVRFLDNGQLLGTANVVNGVGTLLTSLLTSGQNLITAVFSGVDGLLNLGGSTSPPTPVSPPPSPPPGGGGGGGSGGGGSGGGGGGGGGAGAAGQSVLQAAIEVAIDTAAILLQGSFAAEQELQIASAMFLNQPLSSNLVSDLLAHIGPADGLAIPAIEAGIQFANNATNPSS